MKHPLTTILPVGLLCLLNTTVLWADPKDAATPTVQPPDPSTPVSQEFNEETSYSGRTTLKQGNAKLGGVDGIDSSFDYVVSPQIKDGYLLRLGVDVEQNSFGVFPNAPLPNTLDSANAIVGMDMALSDKILMRAELHPGVFGDSTNVTGNDFDMPVQIGGTYLMSQNLQFILGIQIDLKSNYPVIGLPGVRWQFADKWVLSAIPPKPQLQYEVNNALTLYTGAELMGGTYQLNSAFGSNHGHGPGTTNSQFNDNVVDYTEIHVGAGLTWKFMPNLSLDVSGGYVPYRNFEIHADKVGYDTRSTGFHNSLGDGAPYASIGISGSF